MSLAAHRHKHACYSTAMRLLPRVAYYFIAVITAIIDKNSSGDEIANVNFCTTTTYMERPAPTPIEPLLSTINIYGT